MILLMLYIAYINDDDVIYIENVVNLALSIRYDDMIVKLLG